MGTIMEVRDGVTQRARPGVGSGEENNKDRA